MIASYPAKSGRFENVNVDQDVSPNQDYYDEKTEIDYPGVPSDEKNIAIKITKKEIDGQIAATQSRGFYFRASICKREDVMDEGYCHKKAAELFYRLHTNMPHAIFQKFLGMCVQCVQNKEALKKRTNQ